MFWRVSGFAQPSPVEAALDRPKCTLENLLAEDDLIQEVKSLNSRVLEFLTKPECVTGLVRHLVAPAPPDADQQQQLRQPFAACEVLCCEVEGLLTQLLGDESTMDLLFSLLQQTGTLDCVTAGYFARVVGMLLFRRTSEVMTFLQNHRHLLGRLVAHLDTASISEILIRLVGAEEQTGMYLPPSQVQWLTGTDLMPQLLAMLEPGHSPDAAKHAAEVLASVARSALSPLARCMAEPNFLQTLLERAFEESGPSSVQALDVCIALLEPRPTERHHTQPSSPAGSVTGLPIGSPVAGSSLLGSSPGSGSLSASSELRRMSEATAKNLQTAAVKGISDRAARLRAMLEDSAALAPLETAFGVLDPPLGSGRLKAVEMVAALARLGSPDAEEALVRVELLPRCMALFVQYPFNNLLHHQVATMLMGVLEFGSSTLTAHTFGGAGLLGWLTGAPAEVRPRPRPADPRADQRPSLRAGYMGHITYIANKLAEASERSLFVSKQLADSKAWADFAAGTLQERNTLENVQKWACGRPAPSELATISDAPDEAGLMDLDQGPAGSLDSPTDGDGGNSPTADGAGQRYFHDAAGDDEDDPVFRDASDALDALRLNPHILPAGAKPGRGSDSSDDSSDGSNGSGSGSPPPPPHAGAGSGSDALARSLEAEGDSGVLVVISDEEELLLEDDAVVVGVPRALGPQAAGGSAPAQQPATPHVPLPPPPAAEAVLPATAEASPDGLDPTKPVSAATPSLVPPLAAAAAAGAASGAVGAPSLAALAASAAAASHGSGSPPSAPVSIPAGTGGDSHPGATAGGVDGAPQDEAQVGPRPGHSGGVVSANSLLHRPGSSQGANADGNVNKDGIGGSHSVPRHVGSMQHNVGEQHGHPTAASNPHRAPKSAFASWRPTWQAVEDQAAAAAASAAQEYVAKARGATSSSSSSQGSSGSNSSNGGDGSTSSGGGDGSNGRLPVHPPPADAAANGPVAIGKSIEAVIVATPVERDSKAPADASADGPQARTGSSAGGSVKQGTAASGGGTMAGIAPVSRAADGRPKFAWATLQQKVAAKEADGFARHFTEGENTSKYEVEVPDELGEGGGNKTAQGGGLQQQPGATLGRSGNDYAIGFRTG